MRISKTELSIRIGFFIGFLGLALTIGIVLVEFFQGNYDIIVQGNHDTTVEQGNHDTTVEVKKELCELAIQQKFGVEMEEDLNVKVHTIGGKDGEVVASVFIMYKQFPFVIKMEEKNVGATDAE